MRRRSVIQAARWCALFAAVAVPASAAAPPNQYDFFDRSDMTIRDKQTHLEWMRPRDDEPYPAAVKFTDAVNACNAQGGKRLPTVKELLTIIDEAPHAQYVVDHNEPRYIDKDAFFNTPKLPVWTQTDDPIDPSNAITVDFSTGTVGSTLKTDSRIYRCVDNY